MNTATRATNVDALRMLFGINYEVLKNNLDGITHEQSLLQPQGGGNCLNWVLGHIVATRDIALQLLKQEPVWSKEEAASYRRGSPPIRDAAQAQPLDKIFADLGRSQDRLAAALAQATESQLSAPAPDRSVGETVGDTLFVLHMHDAYHAGQTGLLRRMAGHQGAIK